jgi:hypothetical protein
MQTERGGPQCGPESMNAVLSTMMSKEEKSSLEQWPRGYARADAC